MLFEDLEVEESHAAEAIETDAVNGTWVVGVAKAGREEGVDMMGGSAIISPNGEIVALCNTLEDELVTAACDLDAGKYIKQNVFNFDAHRRPEHYGLIVETTGVVEPR